MNVFRKLRRDWKWFLINVVGLGTALACVLIVYIYSRQELSFDRFHTKADRIYRITVDSNRGATSMHPARVAGDLPRELMSEYPAIEDMVRLTPFRNAVIRIGEQSFFTQRAFSTDSSFFRVFDFKILVGNAEKTFSQPGRAFICRSMAMKYFGTLDVVGKEISILHQKGLTPRIFTIDGVMEDFPRNSHFQAELLTSFSDVESGTTWAYTYYLMKSGTDVKTLARTIQQKLDKDNQSTQPAELIYLQKLTDIHLYSHKTREMEKNGNVRSLYLLGTGTFIILLIALANYLNLSRVQYHSQITSLKVKMINGASKQEIAREIIGESQVLSLVSALAGIFIAVKIGGSLGISIIQSDKIIELTLIVLLLIIVTGLIAVFPLYASPRVLEMKTTIKHSNLNAVPLVVQFALAMVTITGTIVLNRQVNYISSQHPASENANMLLIPNSPTEVVQRYELFKAELLKSTVAVNVTSALEVPGGDVTDNFEFDMEGVEKKEGQTLNIFTADSGFFGVLGINPIAGTTDLGFTPSQQWEADAVALNNLQNSQNPDPEKIAELQRKVGTYREKYILNQSALNLLGITNPQDAIGKRFRLNFFIDELFPEGEVVGVVPDFHYTNLRNEEKPLVIVPRKMFNSCFIIRINPARHDQAVSTIESVWKKINPGYPFQYEYLTDSYRRIYADEYAQTRVLSMFALISILLSSLGMFALAAFTMQRRVKEIGIRKINGARVWEVMMMLNREFLKWVAIGFIIAIPVSWYAMHRWLESFAYKTPLSWWIFALAGLLSFLIALITVSWLSWRAATRNPVESLRYE